MLSVMTPAAVLLTIQSSCMGAQVRKERRQKAKQLERQSGRGREVPRGGKPPAGRGKGGAGKAFSARGGGQVTGKRGGAGGRGRGGMRGGGTREKGSGRGRKAR